MTLILPPVIRRSTAGFVVYQPAAAGRFGVAVSKIPEPKLGSSAVHESDPVLPVTVTGKTGAASSTSLDPSFGSGVFNSASPNIPAAAGWYTANPAVDILITGGKIKVMQFAVTHNDAGWTGKVSVGYKLQGTTTALYAMNLTYSVGIPAPGAFALLGLAGLVSSRRRRG